MKFVLAVTAATAALLSASASAQDFSLNPNYGAVNLQAGFTPDPYSVQIVSGGDIDASQALGNNCLGMISNAPDFRINYSAGSFDLYISAITSGDATLVINAPDGSWHCDDDYAGNLNPGIQFYGPLSGQYDIWVGDLRGDFTNGTLRISELSF